MANMRRWVAAILSMIMLLSGTVLSYAEDGNDTIKLVATADTYITAGGNWKVNHGAEEIIASKRASDQGIVDADRRTYIKFDMSECSTLTSSELKAAKISLTNAGGAASGAKMYVTKWVDWQESTFTAETEPFYNVASPSYNFFDNNSTIYTYVGEINIDAGSTVNINLTNYIKEMLNSAEYQFTVVIIGEGNSTLTARQNMQLASKETTLGEAAKPTLILEKKIIEASQPEDAVLDINISNNSANEGADEIIVSQNSSGLVKFHLQNKTPEDISNAKLSLYVTTGNGVIDVYEVNNSWNGTSSQMPARIKEAGSKTVVSGERNEIDVTKRVVNALLSGKDEISFEIVSASEIKIQSIEYGANRPRLYINEKATQGESVSGKITRSIAEDSYVRIGENVNHGAEPVISLKDGMREVYIKISLDDITSSDFNKAIFSMYAVNAEYSTVTKKTYVYAVNADSWQESLIQHSNTPAKGEKIAELMSAPVGEWTDIDITDYIRAEKNSGKSMASFVIVQVDAAAPINISFNSREAEENTPVLNLYYPKTGEDRKNIVDYTTFDSFSEGLWTEADGIVVDGGYELVSQGEEKKLQSVNYVDKIGVTDDKPISNYRMLIKARIKASGKGALGISLADRNGPVTKLGELRSDDSGIKAYINKSSSGAGAEITNISEKQTDEWLQFVAVVDNNTVSYFVDGKAEGKVTFSAQMPTQATYLRFTALSEGTEKFTALVDDVEMYAVDAYYGDLKFDMQEAEQITIDSVQPLKLTFSNEIYKEAFYGKVSINDAVIPNNRISVDNDSKTLVILPEENGFNEFAKSTFYIDTSDLYDVFEQKTGTQFLCGSFDVTGWNLSAKITNTQWSSNTADVSFTLYDRTGAGKDVVVLAVRCEGTQEKYTFSDDIIAEEFTVTTELSDSISLPTTLNDGFIQVFVYCDGTYEPLLRKPYVFN